MVVFDFETGDVPFTSETESVELEEDEQITITYPGPWGDDLQKDHTYALFLIDKNNEESLCENYYFQLTSGTSGLESINAAGSTVEYYNLQGMRIDAPVKGSICIVKKGDKLSKQIIK